MLGYDDQGRLTTLTHSNGRQLFLEYNSEGRLGRLIDPMGPGDSDDRTTVYEYDASGKYLTNVTAPDGSVTLYSYNGEIPVEFKPSGPRGGTIPGILVPDPRSHALRSIAFADGTHDFFAYDAARPPGRDEEGRRCRARHVRLSRHECGA